MENTCQVSNEILNTILTQSMSQKIPDQLWGQGYYQIKCMQVTFYTNNQILIVMH